MLWNPTAPVHEGSGSASSGPVVASPQSVARTTMSCETESDVQLRGTTCAVAGSFTRPEAALRRRGRHEARARDRKQSHECDGRASGHMQSVRGKALRRASAVLLPAV